MFCIIALSRQQRHKPNLFYEEQHMFISSIQEAIELARTAKVTFIEDNYTHSCTNNDGSIDISIDCKIEFDHPQADRMVINLSITDQYLRNVTEEDIRVFDDNLLTAFMVQVKDGDVYDTERWKLGYTNQFDQPTPMDDHLARPDAFILAHTNYVAEFKAYVNQHFIKKHRFDPMGTPLDNYALRARTAS